MLTVIKAPPRGNDKLGPVLTESRPTGLTCPDTCPFKGRDCYSSRADGRRPDVLRGWTDRENARLQVRREWRANRSLWWERETAAGRPVRFLVHGDLLSPETGQLDRGFLADILTVARGVPGFHGWGYTHAWRYLSARHLRHLKDVGITMWASCHTYQEAMEARKKGFPVAMISTTRAKGYRGPRIVTAAGMPALVCPHQTGHMSTCLSCGFCWKGRIDHKPDLILLYH